MEATELRRELARVRAEKRGRYPAALRDAVLEYASRAKKQGRSRREVAVELGVSDQTMTNWRKAASKRGSLAPVTVVTQPEHGSQLVVEYGPLRVRGLDVGGVAELLRRLA
jgi:transposase-like protein